LNLNNWIIVDNCDHGGDPQIYKYGNVSFSNGIMKIRLKDEITNFNHLDTIPDSYACGTHEELQYFYSSGWVETVNSKAFGNGFIEARMKLPADYHASTGFWTWRDDDSPVQNESEVDVVEMTRELLNAFTTTKFSTHVHTNNSNQYPNFPERDELYQVISPVNFDFTEWHTYGLEKSPHRLVWYVDNIPVRVLYNHYMFDEARIIFNLMIRESSNLPSTINQSLQIDYFKCYSVNYNCQNNGVICGGLFPQNSHFETLTVGLNECVNNLPFGANIILNAHEFIQLNKNFNCPVGTELLLQTGMCH
jgi:beta-glucanase (GH16 family)